MYQENRKSRDQWDISTVIPREKVGKLCKDTKPKEKKQKGKIINATYFWQTMGRSKIYRLSCTLTGCTVSMACDKS